LNLSARTQYACTAVLELALHYETGQPVQVRRIAERHGIPARFLVQILLQLKAAGLVASTRGASGGYRLVKSPREISLGDVMGFVEGPGSGLSEEALLSSPVAGVLHDRWLEIAAVQQRMLAETTFVELVEQVRETVEPMYYI
jgi:Rrf2 family protein